MTLRASLLRESFFQSRVKSMWKSSGVHTIFPSLQLNDAISSSVSLGKRAGSSEVSLIFRRLMMWVCIRNYSRMSGTNDAQVSTSIVP